MAQQQRLVFIFSKTPEGSLKIDCQMFPKMPPTEEDFRQLPMYQQELMSTAAQVGKFAMQAIMDKEMKENK